MHHGCANVKGFAGNIVFLLVNRASAADKSWLACAAVSGVIALAWNFSRIARVPSDFFSSLMTLCYCVLHVWRHLLHWNCCVQRMCYRVVRCLFLCFATQCLQIAVAWLRQGASLRQLHAQYYCVLQLTKRKLH